MGADVDTVGNARWRTLGPDLYDGTAGVALFLAELFGASGDTRLRTTAVGAMRHALDRVERLPSSHALGLFTGRIGVAMAAARVGCITGVDELPARAPHILNSLEINRDEVPPYDVISGMAGAIVGLLVLRELLPEPSLFDRAEGFGHALLDGAHKLKRGWSWKTLNARGEADLTGFSHGAAGIGYALLELFAASGDSRYAAGAMQAFAFERSWFSAANRNWPDLRGLSSRTTRPDQSLPACPFWCHGAPGIAVSRIRGFDITRDDHCHTEAIMALTTTAAVTEGALRNDDLNYSLCHGLSGNAEILRLGERALGDAVVGASRIVSEVAAAGIEKYGAEPTSWPCGAGGLTPALMTGLAGIGHYYLRLFSSAVPSVLMLTPGDFAGVVEHDAASTPVAARTG
jgi:lantibiotic modifying enzyme